jgi:hypothetical protein
MSLAFIEVVLAGLNVERDVRDAIAGDLLEERSTRAAACGDDAANRWMRLQIVRSLPVIVWGTLRNGGFRVSVAVVGAALIALFVVSAVISAVMLSSVITRDAVRSVAVLALVVDLSFGTAGGYLAARLGRAAPLAAAFVFGAFAVILTSLSAPDATGWYLPTLQLFLIPATVMGGWLRARSLAQRAFRAR